MNITQLWIYPIKSCGGVQLSEAKLGERGLEHDRQWMLVDRAGNLITQREVPKLVWLRPLVSEDELRVSAPDMPELKLERNTTGETKRVRVWGDHMDAVVIPEARAWFESYTEREVDLVFMPDSSPRPMNPNFGTRHLTFVDGNPLHIISEASVTDLNSRLEKPVGLERFRANIVFSGGEPYAEDAWTKIIIDDIEFDVYEACQRCVMLNVDPVTARTSKEPLATLATYRRSGQHVVFGRNISHLREGMVRVGGELRDDSSA
jgi:uncharacterized protein